MTKNSDKNWSLLICLTLTLTLLAVYYQVRSFNFVNIDDPDYVSENPNIQAGITLQSVKWAFTSNVSNHWHPLTWLSHILDWQLYGSNAGGHHLTNLFFHIANTLLLFLVLKRMTNAIWQSAFVAALFALHPLHVEAVAWISSRKDVLSTFFWLLTMAAYLRYVKRPGVLRYLLTLFVFALGLMAKPMLVTLPFVLLLLDYWPLNRIKHFGRQVIYRLILEKIPFIILLAVSSVITFLVQQSGGAVIKFTDFGMKYCIYNAFISYITYIGKMFWPSHLAVFYPHPVENVSVLYAVISAAALLTVTILVIRFAKNHRYLVTGWFWYLGTLVPVIGIVQVGSQAMADRYTYITLTGLFIIIAWGMPDLLTKWKYKKNVLVSSAILVILAMSVCTYFQLRYWRNNLALFQHALKVTKNNYMAHFNVGSSLFSSGRLDEAIQNYSQAIRIVPYYLKAQIGLSYALLKAGKVDQVVIECQKFLQKYPDDPNLLNNLGVAFGRQGKFDQAVKYLTKALQINPYFAEAHINIGYALALQGNLNEAVVHFVDALRLDPRSAIAHYHLGCILMQEGRIDEGITHFKQALLINPDFTDAKNSLNAALAEKQKSGGKDANSSEK